MRGAVAARVATVVALAAASVLVGVKPPAGAASPPSAAAPAGTLDGRSRLTVDLPGDAQAPGSVTVTVLDVARLPVEIEAAWAERDGHWLATARGRHR